MSYQQQREREENALRVIAECARQLGGKVFISHEAMIDNVPEELVVSPGHDGRGLLISLFDVGEIGEPTPSHWMAL